MYPVTVQHSLLVAFLLSLKGSYIHSAGDICAPVGSTAHLSCPYPCSKKYIWTLNKKRLNLFKSDQKKYSLDTNTCSLTVQNLNKTDGGTYRYCETDVDDDDDDDDCRKRCTTTLCVTDVMIDSTGIIILSSLLVLLTLMMIGAAVWRRRKNLRRPEGNESQSTNPSLPYTVFENIPAASTEHQRQKKEESDHENDVQYYSVHFSKIAHQPAARVDDVQYADIKVSGRSDAPY